jgi:hypothetical protein
VNMTSLNFLKYKEEPTGLRLAAYVAGLIGFLLSFVLLLFTGNFDLLLVSGSCLFVGFAAGGLFNDNDGTDGADVGWLGD